MFTLTTLIENKCVVGKVRTMFQVSELLSAQEKLSKQMEEMRVGLSSKDADILHLKMKNQ